MTEKKTMLKEGGRKVATLVAVCAAGAMLAAPAEAYVGPSLGLGVIGAVIGVLAAVILTLFGLVWYPMKRMLGKKPAVAGNAPEIEGAAADDVGKDRTD